MAEQIRFNVDKFGTSKHLPQCQANGFVESHFGPNLLKGKDFIHPEHGVSLFPMQGTLGLECVWMSPVLFNAV